ncbi:TraR/DksA family transcriptional regulator [Rhizobium sp. SAFR-030]|uniref:TraR/DksA family transcriptional regulator n=1 Tax=Rhizobium sp. SAFR-030 TaxID=3387277 RepID=UPI003F7F5AEC
MTRSSSTDLKHRDEKYRPILVQRQQQLQARLERIEHDFEQPRDRDDDDGAVERNNDEVLEELGEVGQKELVAIEAALGRMRQDAFGICVKCGSPISDERLDLVPHTPFCQSCSHALQLR